MISKLISTTLVLALLCTSAYATQTVTEKDVQQKEQEVFGFEASQEPQHHFQGAWLDSFHNPTPGITMTADIRFREIYGWNTNLLNNNAGHLSFERYRFRWGIYVDLDENVRLNSRLVNEFRTWDEPQSRSQHTNFDEILFDDLNIEINNFLDMPLRAIVGRQNFVFGSGWLIVDGTPLDGSRTNFFDSARLTYDWEEKNTVIDMIYINQSAAADRWLKPINDREVALTEQDEQGVIVYMTNNSVKDTQLEGYFIYRNDNPLDYTPNFNAAWSKKAEILTFGGAYDRKIDENWNIRLEGAIQRGEKEDRDLRAIGTLDKLTYSFNDCKNNVLALEYEYLSGDDPSTDDDEAFDPLWGEYARFSEVYPYIIVTESALGEFTNMHRAALSHSVDLSKCWNLKTTYSLFWADENTQNGVPFNDGGHKFRGQLFSSWLTFQCCKQLKAYYMIDYFMPGNYYDDDHRGGSTFMRFNLEYTF